MNCADNCADSEQPQNPNDEFKVYETWIFEGIEYLIGRVYQEGISIIVDCKEVKNER